MPPTILFVVSIPHLQARKYIYKYKILGFIISKRLVREKTHKDLMDLSIFLQNKMENSKNFDIKKVSCATK